VSIVMIVNPVAGRETGAEHGERLEDQLRRRGVEPTVLKTEKPGDARAFAADLDGTDRLLCVGGDGTLNEVVNGVDLSDPPRIQICPVGTGNVMAGEISTPWSPEKQVRAVLGHRYRWFDVGRSDAGRFLSMAGIGFDAEVVHAFHRNRGTTLNMMQYGVIGARTLVCGESVHVRVEVDGTLQTRSASFAQIANTRNYGGPQIYSPDARPTDGRLEVSWLRDGSRGRLFQLTLSAMLGCPRLCPGYRSTEGQRVRVIPSGEHTPKLQLDGDPASFEDGCFSVHPRAIPLFI